MGGVGVPAPAQGAQVSVAPAAAAAAAAAVAAATSAAAAAAAAAVAAAVAVAVAAAVAAAVEVVASCRVGVPTFDEWAVALTTRVVLRVVVPEATSATCLAVVAAAVACLATFPLCGGIISGLGLPHAWTAHVVQLGLSVFIL
jgi:hypothetical protein